MITIFPGEQQFQVAKKVLQTIETNGYEAYVVGGAVRDVLLGRQVTDIDITTSATPQQIGQLFKKTIPTGIAHGTISVFEEGIWFEVTTYRLDGPYDDGRHPRYVHFDTTLEGDLSRRDFTINAMAMDLRGVLHDPFHGYDDLVARRIKAVGEPIRRFQEDGLRVARAFRFAATLQFTIVDSTMKALKESSVVLGKIAAERRQDEWNKFLSSLTEPFCSIVSDLIIQAWTGWHGFHWSALCNKITHVHGLPDRLALIIWGILQNSTDVSSPDVLLQTLRYSTKTVNEVLALLHATSNWQADSYHPMTLAWGKVLSLYGENFLKRTVNLYVIQNPELQLDDELQRAERWKQACTIRNLKDLAIHGNDLTTLFSIRGPLIGVILEHLFSQVARHAVINTRESLLQEVRMWMMNTSLDEAIIRQFLQITPRDFPIYGYAVLSSTNDVAREKITADKVNMLAVFTDNQEQGRGRQGRAWISPPGTGLALSIAARIPATDADRIQEWPLLAAITVRSAIASMGITEVMIKWPNDIFIQGKKVCGILTELRSEGHEFHLIVGIGINVNAGLEDFPETLQTKVTSLKIANQQAISVNRLTARLIDEFYRTFLKFSVTQLFRDLKQEYEQYCITIGTQVHVKQGANTIVGYADHIDENGTLWIVDEAGVSRPIRSGEIVDNGRNEV